MDRAVLRILRPARATRAHHVKRAPRPDRGGAGPAAPARGRRRRSPTPATATLLASLTAARSPANATTRWRVLGDCGLRSAERRGLPARDLRRPRSNARHYRLFVRGKRGRACEVPAPAGRAAGARGAAEVHPLARGVGLLDEQP